MDSNCGIFKQNQENKNFQKAVYHVTWEIWNLKSWNVFKYYIDYHFIKQVIVRTRINILTISKIHPPVVQNKVLKESFFYNNKRIFILF
jgi:hypothetical protein